MKPEEVSQRLDRVVAYLPLLARVFGDEPDIALFLCQLLFWTGKAKDPDGWIRKTLRELYVETGLTRSRQARARRYLRKVSILEEKHSGAIPPVTAYRVNIENLREAIEKFCEDQGVACGSKKLSKASATQSAKMPNPTVPVEHDEEVHDDESISYDVPDQSATLPQYLIGEDDFIDDNIDHDEMEPKELDAGTGEFDSDNFVSFSVTGETEFTTDSEEDSPEPSPKDELDSDDSAEADIRNSLYGWTEEHIRRAIQEHRRKKAHLPK